MPDPELSVGYGDIQGTEDAILVIFDKPGVIDIYIARGHKNNSRNIYMLFVDGELFQEMQHLVHQSNPLIPYNSGNHGN